jgi:acyl carrier protein
MRQSETLHAEELSASEPLKTREPPVTNTMQDHSDVLAGLTELLDDVLQLNGRAMAFTADTPLVGSVPELDSMAVVMVLEAIEQRFDITIPDDAITGEAFATVGSLDRFIREARAQ